MAKGLDKHRERLDKLSLLGKDLTRRSGACCELCEASGTRLSTVETVPVPSDPEIERCLFICETCAEQLKQPKRMNADHLRCLAKSVWSQEPVVQVSSVRLLRVLAPKHEWAADVLESLYLEPEIEAWVEEG